MFLLVIMSSALHSPWVIVPVDSNELRNGYIGLHATKMRLAQTSTSICSSYIAHLFRFSETKCSTWHCISMLLAKFRRAPIAKYDWKIRIYTTIKKKQMAAGIIRTYIHPDSTEFECSILESLFLPLILRHILSHLFGDRMLDSVHANRVASPLFHIPTLVQ